MQVNFNEMQFKVPQFSAGEQVLFFNYAEGKFGIGVITIVDVRKWVEFEAISYTIQIDEKRQIPGVPEALIFNTTKEAMSWITKCQTELVNL